uniref:Uncharacterized protein n=1 Tax=Desulfobacca acetoxidans TaxID=60893 RepID=A0A7C5AK90_9BACT
MMHIPKRQEEIGTLQYAFFIMGGIEKSMKELFQILSNLKEAGNVPYCIAFQKAFYALNAYLEALQEAYETAL